MKVLVLIIVASVLATCSRAPTLLEEIQEIGVLRVVTRTSPTTYYTGSNGPEGPEYDLVKGFAAFLGVELDLITANRFSDLIPTIENGSAHLAAAGLTVTPEREARVDFGPAYQEVRQYLIYKLGTGRPRAVSDVVGKRLEVVAGTSYVETLQNVQAVKPELVFTENPNTDIAELLLNVSEQRIDYTVADSSLFAIYRNFVPEIRVGFELAVGDSLAWALPQRHDDSLYKRIEDYLGYIRENGDLDRIMDRYYGHTQRFDYVGTRRFIRDYRNKLPKYRDTFESAADNLGLDWRMLAAIGYQESHWNPHAISPTGVRGIMMLTENTASGMGIADRVDPVQSIEGGSAYLLRMKRRFGSAITEPDRTWLALAAYNVGFGHVQDARQIARDQGLDANLWINVKQTLPLLTQRRWYEATKHGYARGWEPVMYVENVRNYYDILIWLTNDERRRPQRDAGPDKIIARSGTDAAADEAG